MNARELRAELLKLGLVFCAMTAAIVACGTPPPPDAKLRAAQVECLISRTALQLGCVDQNETRAAIDACRARVRALDCAAMHDAGVEDGAP